MSVIEYKSRSFDISNVCYTNFIVSLSFESKYKTNQTGYFLIAFFQENSICLLMMRKMKNTVSIKCHLIVTSDLEHNEFNLDYIYKKASELSASIMLLKMSFRKY